MCGEGVLPRVARAELHPWEEPCLIGEKGSGAVFFAGCSLRCVFCQNREITAGSRVDSPGIRTLTPEQLADVFLRLQEKEAANINLVTATQFIPAAAESIRLARQEGMKLPVVFNCGGYESVEALILLDGLVDIYLPDFKYFDPETAKHYAKAPDYPEAAKLALAEMVRQTGPPIFDDNGQMKRGTMVRHLALPGETEDSKAILAYLWETYGDQIWLSLLNQYTPQPGLENYPNLQRPLTEQSYDELVDFAWELGFRQAFIQEGETVSESFIPAFDGTGLDGI